MFVGGATIYELPQNWDESFPHAWGCFQRDGAGRNRRKVFPTFVGVFLILQRHVTRLLCLPHVRGGLSARLSENGPSCLPHVRGGVSADSETRSTQMGVFPTFVGVFPKNIQRPILWLEVFPTYVGVFLRRKKRGLFAKSLPHVRGGVSVDYV